MATIATPGTQHDPKPFVLRQESPTEYFDCSYGPESDKDVNDGDDEAGDDHEEYEEASKSSPQLTNQQYLESLFQPNFVSKSYTKKRKSSKKSKKRMNMLREDDRTDSMISTVSMISSSIGGFEVEMDTMTTEGDDEDRIIVQTPTFFPPPTIIEEGTPAAAAVKANAEVKVGSVGKAARSVNAQVVRRMVKHATLRGNFGTVKGKPPRVPPAMSQQYQQQIIDQHQPHRSDDEITSDNDAGDEYSEYEDQVVLTDEEAISRKAPGSDDEGDELGFSTPNRKPRGDYKDSQTSAYHSCQSASTPSPKRSPSRHQILVQPDYEYNAAPVMPDGPSLDLNLPPASSATLATELTAVSNETSLAPASPKTPASTPKTPRSSKSKKLRYPKKQKSSKTLKKLKKEKTAAAKKSYLKGKVIDRQHEQYTLSIAVMLGVHTSIVNMNNSAQNPNRRKRALLKWEDFYKTEKYEFSPRGSSKTPAHELKHTFKFKDYSPAVYAYLRRFFGVDDPEFLQSVCGKASFIDFISNSRSGQFFFYSNDGKYVIKTMTNSESKFLRQILPDYFRYCSDNPNTLLVKFLGMYRVKLYHLRKNVKFVIMNSVFYTDKYLHTLFDLKGSISGRDAKPGDFVLKDNDLRKSLAKDSSSALTLPADIRERLRKQVVKDSDFLKSIGVMDYSMVVGIHNIPRPTSTNTEEDSDFFMDDDGSYVDGSENRKSGLHYYNNHYIYNSDEDNDEVKRTKQQDRDDIERMFWPFHRLYDLHGHRIMRPRNCSCASSRSPRTGEQKQCSFCSDCNIDLGPYFKGGRIPAFVSPISDRKDYGLMSSDKSKIFYLGVIDILQEFNSRKKVEAAYRSWQNERLHAGDGDAVDHKYDASCVDPNHYASRFVSFFNEYCPEVHEKHDAANGGPLSKTRINIDEDLQEVLMASYINNSDGHGSPQKKASFDSN